MRNQWRVFLIVMLLGVTPVMGWKTKPPAPDPFTGRYKKALGFRRQHGEMEFMTITQTNGIYYCSAPFSAWGFTNASASQLRNYAMGTITLGKLSFADQPGEVVPVLRCEFCYESFLLVGESLHGRGNRKDF